MQIILVLKNKTPSSTINQLSARGSIFTFPDITTMRRRNATNVIAKKIPRVYASNKTASFFFPFKYQTIGRPKIKVPVKAAEKTKSISIAIGINIVSSPPENLFPRKKINDTTSTMYAAVPKEFITAYFNIFFTKT